MATLDDCRAAYARKVVATAGALGDDPLLAAFAQVPRERFTGPPPWRIHAGPVPLLSSDPADYQDALVSLSPERRINNGSPSLHAACLHAMEVKRGDQVLHVGAGTGYYSAMLAELVGPSGEVQAYEIEPDLAEAAARNLQPWPAVRVRARSGVQGPLPMADIVYVSAGATRPVAAWLDALKPAGRLVFPLTAGDGCGAMAMIGLLASGAHAVRFLLGVSFIDCIGARDAQEAAALAVAFEGRGSPRSLLRHGPPDASVWCAGQGWWFSCREPAVARVS